MFSVASAEVADRILQARRFIDAVKEDDTSQQDLTSTLKGLLFIELYGVYEYTVRSAVQSALSSLQSSGVGYSQIRREALALALDPLWDSCAGAGPARKWESRIALMQIVGSSQIASAIDATAFPRDGSHYRPRQLLTIWEIFGLTCPTVPDMRFLGRIEELVENRNAIAHGRRTASDVGKRYSKLELRGRVDDLNAVCNHLIDSMKGHVDAGALLAANPP